MAERFLNLVCPKCKNGVKYDSLTGMTTFVPLEDYPRLTEEGKAWCKTCQHGTFPDDDGLCLECKGKGRFTRLQPKLDKVEIKLPLKEEKVIVEEVKEEVLTVEKTAPKPKRVAKQVVGNTDTK